jgi:hypothetical protein
MRGLLGDSKEALEERLALRGPPNRRRKRARFDAKTLLKQEDELERIYRPPEGVVLDTTNWTVAESAKWIARNILLEPYCPFNFRERLSEIINKDGEL